MGTVGSNSATVGSKAMQPSYQPCEGSVEKAQRAVSGTVPCAQYSCNNVSVFIVMWRGVGPTNSLCG